MIDKKRNKLLDLPFISLEISGMKRLITSPNSKKAATRCTVLFLQPYVSLLCRENRDLNCFFVGNYDMKSSWDESWTVQAQALFKEASQCKSND